MPANAIPEPESSQELAWRLANPLLAELTTAKIRELQAERRGHLVAAAKAEHDLVALRRWQLEQTLDPLPFSN